MANHPGSRVAVASAVMALAACCGRTTQTEPGPGAGGGNASGGGGSGGGATAGGAAGVAGGGGLSGFGGQAVDGSDGAEGTGGAAEAGDSGPPQDGSDGGEAGNVEYRACEYIGGYGRITFYRIDRVGGTCAAFVISDSGFGCLFGLTSELWCPTGASISADVPGCEAGAASTAVVATGATGTFSRRFPRFWDMDITFQFQGDGGLPTSVRFQATGCVPDCALNDCRN